MKQENYQEKESSKKKPKEEKTIYMNIVFTEKITTLVSVNNYSFHFLGIVFNVF